MPNRNRFVFQNAITSGSLLLVEGIDDARFFDAFLQNKAGDADVQIATVGGKANFRKFLTNLRQADGFDSLRQLGIARDADTDSSSAFQSIRDALRDNGYPVPQLPWAHTQSGHLSVSVAILPGENEPGELEDLCLRSIAGRPELACVDQYIKCMTDAGLSSDKTSGPNRVYAYLAAGERPGLRLGESAEAGVWDWDSPAFMQVADFLRQLAGG